LHQTHILVHIPILRTDFERISAAIEAGGEIEDHIADVQYLQRALNHTHGHVEELRLDPVREQEVAEYDNALGQLDAAWKRLADEVQAAATEAPQEGQQVSPEMQAKMAEHNFKMQAMQDAHQLKLRQKEEDHQQRMRLRNIQTDVRLSQNILNHNLKTYGPAAVPRRK
jgi:hypothetical protein